MRNASRLRSINLAQRQMSVLFWVLVLVSGQWTVYNGERRVVVAQGDGDTKEAAVALFTCLWLTAYGLIHFI